MEFFEVIEKRYSYRGAFKDQPVPKEDLVKIVEAAVKAPSGLNRQTCGFVVVTEPALRAKLNEIFPHQGIASAPAVIVALSSYKEVYKGKAFEIHDYAAAVENILLAVTALGYATVWTDGETADGDRQAPHRQAFGYTCRSNRQGPAAGGCAARGRPAEGKEAPKRAGPLYLSPQAAKVRDRPPGKNDA